MTPSHPALRSPHQGANSGISLSRGERRRNRRLLEMSISSNLSTCRVPLPEDSPPIEATGGWSWTDVYSLADIADAADYSPPAESGISLSRAVGDFSATTFRDLVRAPAQERIRGPVESPGGIIQSSFQSNISPTQRLKLVQQYMERQRRETQVITNPPQTVEREAALVRPSHDGLGIWGGVPYIPTAAHDGWSALRVVPSVPTAEHDGPTFTNEWGYYNMLQRQVGPRTGGPADISALENSWGPTPPSGDQDVDINSWDTDLVLLSTATDLSNLGETARHASRLLEAFSASSTPPMAGSLSSTQQRLLAAALSSILAITPGHRTDGAPQTNPLPLPVDLAMRPDATCVVCYERLANTVLVPCWHLVLCAVCFGLSCRGLR